MKCPICNHELEIKNKKTGETENGEAIYNEFAICHDCKKQWNLDKQRAKNNTKTDAEKKAPAAEAPTPKKKKRRPAAKTSSASPERPLNKKPRSTTEASVEPTGSNAPETPKPKKKKRPVPKPDVMPQAAEPSAVLETPPTAEPSDAPAPKPRKKRRPAPAAENVETVRPAFGDEPEDKEAPVRPRPKKKPADAPKPAPKAKKVRPAAKAMEESVEEFSGSFGEDYEERPRAKKRRAIDNTEEEITYSNIPPKHIRDAREQEMRDNYQNMLDEGDEEWEDDDRRFPVWLIVIIVLIVLAAAGFAGYWFLLR